MSDPKPLLVVTGTKREAQTIAGPGILVLAGGGNRARLEADLERLAPEACGVLSYGMAGALHTDLRLGQWIVGTGVTGQGWTGPCDGAFGIALAQRLKTGQRLPMQGLVHAADTLIATAEEKAELHAKTGAIAADMESHLAGQAAHRHGLRFAVLRCISDEAEADLPPAVAVAMKPGGGLALGRILWSLLTRPGQIPALIRTTRRFNTAFTALEAGGKRVLRG